MTVRGEVETEDRVEGGSLLRADRKESRRGELGAGESFTETRWVDVERFYVVEQRALGLIPMNRYLGWNSLLAYKNYCRLAIPRAVARWGMSEAMIKPLGVNQKELARVMNQLLGLVRSGKPMPMPSQ